MTENEVPDELFEERVLCASADIAACASTDLSGQAGTFEDWV